MSLITISELWSELLPHIQHSDRNDAAETVVQFLIDNGYEADEIRTEFRGQREVLSALKAYVDSHEAEEEYVDDEDDYYDDE